MSVQIVGYIIMMVNIAGGPIQPYPVDPAYTKFDSEHECAKAVLELQKTVYGNIGVKFVCIPDFVRR